VTTLTQARDKIKGWEEEAEVLHAKAARLALELSGAGYSERQIAEAIDKSHAHVHFLIKAELLMRKDISLSFVDAYKLAKRKRDRQPEEPVETSPF